MANPTNDKYDVIVIGAGHNGLTTAALLAKRKRKVLVLERRPQVGGLGAWEEFHTGYKAPGVLHDTSGVRHNLIEALKLGDHGLELNPTAPAIYGLQKGGKGLLLHHDATRAADEISVFSRNDAEGYRGYRAFVDKVRGVVNGLLDDAPPQIFGTGGNGLGLLKKARALRGLGKRDMMELLRVIPMSVADWLDEWFETDLLKAVLAGPAVYGNFMGPRSPGSAFNLLVWECRKGPLVKGGAGALVAALEKAASTYGAEIQTNATVERILTKGGSVTGVALAGGVEVKAAVVAATCDPKQTLLDLMPKHDVTETLAHRMQKFRADGTTAKVNVAVGARVELAGRPGELVELVRTGESLVELEKAFDSIKYRRFSERPVLDIYIPSATDSACAPDGHSVLSIMAHFAPYEHANRWSYRSRELLGKTVMTTLDELAPGIEKVVESIDVLTPVEVESRYGVRGGHIFHGEHSIDQLLVRPTPECARYSTPVKGLYLCGSGSHPGGGLTCAPGVLGAKSILKNS